jgi:hypothetical protein
VTTHFEDRTRPKTQRLAYLERRTAELERQLSDARQSLDRETAHYPHSWETAPDDAAELSYGAADEGGHEGDGYDGDGYDGDSYVSDRYDIDSFDSDSHDSDSHDSDSYAGDSYDGEGDLVDDAAPFDAAPFDVAPFDVAPLDLAPVGAAPVPVDAPAPVDNYANPGGELYSAEARTATLINHGRQSATPRRVSTGLKAVAAAVFGLALVITIIVMMLPGSGPTWPAGVARVQAEVTRACQNPDISSEPDQVNFACGKATRQILWVFALLTSGNDPTYAQAGTGREGLEPITPQQGGVVAWSLNLHHPYNPVNPIDSLAVAARAINNIIGGATVTGTYGKPVVQQGLEGHAANCLRYTGSSQVTSHKGFPGLCARPVSSAAGQAALVTDIYQRWVIGASPKAAQTAATLFANARNPGSPQVQAVLKHLPNSDR